jgi:hypothetical protein
MITYYNDAPSVDLFIAGSGSSGNYGALSKGFVESRYVIEADAAHMSKVRETRRKSHSSSGNPFIHVFMLQNHCPWQFMDKEREFLT